jgi:hypothetical protein
MRRIWSALAVAALLSLVPPTAAQAQDQSPPDETERERAERMAEEAMQKLVRAIELFLNSIPQYEMPEVTEDGDIIIRRKRRSPQPEGEPTPGEPEFDETST